MQDNDFDLIDSLFCKIVDKEKKHGLHSLTAEEKVIFLVWHASGIIENGGFQYFFEQELDAEAVAAAYQKIGCDNCAALLRLSLSLFPDLVLQAGWGERVRYMEDNGELFDNLSNGFWEADEEMQKRLAEYIRGRVDHFGSSK